MSNVLQPEASQKSTNPHGHLSEGRILPSNGGIIGGHSTCRNAGIFYRDGIQGVRKNKKTARTWFDTGCKLGDQDACDALR